MLANASSVLSKVPSVLAKAPSVFGAHTQKPVQARLGRAPSARDAALTSSEVVSSSEAVREYRDRFDASADERSAQGTDLPLQYYNLVTGFYEYGWGRSFHFAPRARRESLSASLTRHEHFLALLLGLKAGERVVDLGCGVGGPMRSIARLSGAEITGVNINELQVERARAYNREAGLESLCKVVEADFQQLPFDDASFDAAYDMEAVVHSPDLSRAFGEVYRVLKPGGRVVLSEWCLTPVFDGQDDEHRRVRLGIERGNGIAKLPTVEELLQRVRGAGFEVSISEDLAHRSDPETPWYLPLSAEGYGLGAFRASRIGRTLTTTFVQSLERVRLAPEGAADVSKLLQDAGADLANGGALGIFTPLYLVLATKPNDS